MNTSSLWSFVTMKHMQIGQKNIVQSSVELCNYPLAHVISISADKLLTSFLRPCENALNHCLFPLSCENCLVLKLSEAFRILHSDALAIQVLLDQIGRASCRERVSTVV